MRSIGLAQASLNLLLQRVTNPSRKTFGKYLYEHGTVVADIAKCRAEIEGARLLVLSAAQQASSGRYNLTVAHHKFKIDKHKAKGALKEIGIAKVGSTMSTVFVYHRSV